MLQSNIFSSSLYRKRAFFICILALTLFIANTNAYSFQATLQWEQNKESDLAGYKLYSGSSSRNYDSVTDLGNQTSYTIENLVDGQTFYCISTLVKTMHFQCKAFSCFFKKYVDDEFTVNGN